MMLEYDKKVYGKRNAWPFTLLQYIFFPGFVLYVLMIITGFFIDYTLPFPEWLSIFTGFYFMFSLVGFPLVSIFKFGIKRLIIRSTLQLNEEKKQIKYEKLAEMNWTFVGHVMEYHNYFIENITEVTETRRFYWIKGDISLNVINNGRHYKHKQVKQVKLAFAYKDMEKIYEFAGAKATSKKAIRTKAERATVSE